MSLELVADVEPYADAFHPEPALIARDTLRRTSEGLAQLPPRCSLVVRLRKVEGLSTREVANRMGISTDTVEKQLTLGIRALADFMLGGTGKIQTFARTKWIT